MFAVYMKIFHVTRARARRHLAKATVRQSTVTGLVITTVRTLVKPTGKIMGMAKFRLPPGRETPERISNKHGIYMYS